MSHPPANPHEQMVALITRHQGALRGYIQSLMPAETALVDDVLQETNLVLWRNAEQYDLARPFMPWACRIAFFQVKSARRDASRDRHLFNSELVDLLAAEQFDDEDETAALDRALQDCLAELPREKRELIIDRYRPDASVGELATIRGQKPNTVYQELHRIRLLLEACVERKITAATT